MSITIEPGMVWPPSELEPILRKQEEWAAWYGGDPERLTEVYQNYGSSSSLNSTDPQPAQRGFFRRLLRNRFWGTSTPLGERPSGVHVPLAGDIAQTSASLLFSSPPQFTASDPSGPVQARMDELVDDGMHASLLEAAETASAHGGVFLTVMVDSTVKDKPWVRVHDPINAFPTWGPGGTLQAVTFCDVLKSDDRCVVRFFEIHEKGLIRYQVYEGERHNLGSLKPLSDYPECGIDVESLDTEDGVLTGVDVLTAVYVPNIRPNRLWNHIPEAKYFGRSDYSGVEDLMSQLDAQESYLAREFRLSKAQIFADRALFNSLGPGNGATIDVDREIMTLTAGLDDSGKDPIQLIQPNIRVDQYQQGIDLLTEQIIRGAGYSAQSFGMNGDTATTATEINARERQSMITRGQKINYWKPALAELMHVLLSIDVQAFGTKGVVPEIAKVHFPDVVDPDPLERAQEIQLLHGAAAISVQEAVKRANPFWTDDLVKAEVARIWAENGYSTTGVKTAPSIRLPVGAGYDEQPGASGETALAPAPPISTAA